MLVNARWIKTLNLFISVFNINNGIMGSFFILKINFYLVLESISRFWEDKVKIILKLEKIVHDNLDYKIILTKIVRKALKTFKMFR